jgi:hypothetical protein
MSQFMNGATRVRGWKTTNSRLDSWADKFNAKLNTQTELLENQQKAAESTKCKRGIAIYIRPSVIELSNKSYFEEENNRWETATSMEAFRYEDDANSSVPWFSDNHSGFINATDADNMSINSLASSEWANFDIQQMFYQMRPHKYV